MTTYRLFPSTNGPSAATSFTGGYIASLAFVVQDQLWLQGYWIWCCSTNGQPTAPPTKAALWQINGHDATAATPTLVPNSAATLNSALTPGWNFIPMTNPIPLSPGIEYAASVAINGPFPYTANFWTAGGPGANGIAQGPLFGLSDNGGTAPAWWTAGQGLYTTSGSDPTVTPPDSTNSSFNSWVDVSVSDQVPVGYTGPFRLWPTCIPGATTDNNTFEDAAQNFVLATEIRLTQTCLISKIWFYSPQGKTQLPTAVAIWSVNSGGLTGVSVYTATASWSGAAGSGWISHTVSGPVLLPVGTYKVSVYNGAATPSSWSPYRYNFWAGSAMAFRSPSVNGITAGPLFAPPYSSSSPGYSYGNAGSTGTHQPGDLTEPSQSCFQVGSGGSNPGNTYPNLVVGVNSGSPGPTYETFWVDMEVHTVVQGAVAMTATGGMTVAATDTEKGAVAMTAVAGMTVAGTAPGVGSIAMTATSGLTVTGQTSAGNSVAMVGGSTLVVGGVVARTGAVALSGSAQLSVTGTTSGSAVRVVMTATAGMVVHAVGANPELAYAVMDTLTSVNSATMDDLVSVSSAELDITRVQTP